MRRVALLLLSIGFIGCPPPPGAGPAGPGGVTPDGKPRWVTRASGAYDGEHGKAFYGVGIVQGIQNEALARQTAGNRARGEIAKIFDLYIAAMMKDYQRSTTAGDFKASAEEQDVVSAQKTITEVTLKGVQVRDHWLDPANGALYALAILDLNAIDKNLAGTNQLPAKIRDYVRDNARRAFNDLDKELQKRSEPEAAPAPEPTEAAAPPPPPRAQPEATPPPPPPPAAKKANPRIGLRVTGVNRATIQTCFAGKLIDAGFQLYEGTSDVDYMIRGQLKYKKAGFNNGTYMVKAWMNVKVNSMTDARLRVAVAEKIKVGRTDLNQSIQLAVTRLCDRVVPKIVQKIKSTL